MGSCGGSVNSNQITAPARPNATFSQVGDHREGSTSNLHNQDTVNPTGTPSNILKQTEFSDLPRETLFNIFSRLPIKLLCRSKCVSKDWLDTIQKPLFQEMHLERATKNPRLVVLDQSDDVFDGDNDLQVVRYFADALYVHFYLRLRDITRGYIHMLPSWFGLVCFYYRGVFLVVNPTSGQFLRVQEGNHCISDELQAAFGYIPETDEYKLIHLFVRCPDEKKTDIHCEILTITQHCGPHINQQSWRQIDATCPFLLCANGVLVNSKSYWLVWSRSEHPDNSDELIAYLDLETETFGFITHPAPTSYTEGNVQQLMKFDGLLCLVDRFEEPCKADFWVLKDPVEIVWEMKYSMDLEMLEGFDDELTEIKPLGFLKGEIVINSGQERLFYWNVETGEFRGGEDRGLEEDNLLALFVESFFDLGRYPQSHILYDFRLNFI